MDEEELNRLVESISTIGAAELSRVVAEAVNAYWDNIAGNMPEKLRHHLTRDYAKRVTEYHLLSNMLNDPDDDDDFPDIEEPEDEDA